MKSRLLNTGKLDTLRAVADIYTDAVRWFLEQSADWDVVTRAALQREFYKQARTMFPIQSTLIQTAMQDAIQIRKSHRALNRRRNISRGESPRSARMENGGSEPVVAKRLPITFRRDSWRLIRTKNGYAVRVPSVSSRQGVSRRISVPIVVGEYQRRHIESIMESSAKQLSLTLAIGQEGFCGIFMSLLPVEVQKPRPVGWLGVDLGLSKMAVTSEGSFYDGGPTLYRKQRWADRRAGLRSHGRMARLREEKGREERWVTDTNHKVARAIVNSAEDKGYGIALENLKGILARVDRSSSRRVRRMNHEWSFAQLVEFITYKATLRGVPVVLVDPRMTSKRCSRCGYTHDSNRKTQAAFVCEECGYKLHADLNAARNIAARAADTYARQAGLAGKGECDTPDGSRPPAN